MKQKFVLRIRMTDDRTRSKAMKHAVQFSGVTSVAIEGVHREQMVLIGNGVDIIALLSTLRKKVAFAELVSIRKVEIPNDGNKQPAKDGNKQPAKDDYKQLYPYANSWNNYFDKSYLTSFEEAINGFLYNTKSDRNPKEAEIVQDEAESRRDDNFLGEANSVDLQNCVENERVEEKKLELSHDFVGHLVKALQNNGVNVDLQRIEESRMALVILSSRYAESRWCLYELVKINQLMEKGKLLVIPILYQVEQLEITELKGDFGVKFWNTWRINRDHHIIEWKEALKSVASMGINCSESEEFITLTVKKFLEEHSVKKGGEKTSLFLSTGKGESTDFNKHHLFGMEQRMEQLEKKLKFDCNETLIIGVVGMPGIGKTTLAVMLHEKWNCKFLRCVPFFGIRKKSEKFRPEWLRKTLLEVLLEGKFPAINHETTHESVKDKLLQTKVFVVLDDVSDKNQLEFLLSDLDWINDIPYILPISLVI